MSNTPIKIAKMRDDWPAVIGRLRNGDRIQLNEQRLLADWIEELHLKSARKRDRDVKRNKARRNRGSAGRPAVRPADKWIQKSKLERADAFVERLNRIEGIPLTKARERAAKEFGYSDGESLRQTLLKRHATMQDHMLDLEIQNIRASDPIKFDRMSDYESKALHEKVKELVNGRWKLFREEEFGEWAYDEE